MRLNLRRVACFAPALCGLLTLCACTAQSAPPAAGAAPDPALAAVLEQIERAPLPAGVDAQLWAQLTGELQRVLAARAAGKLACAPPTTVYNNVEDLVFHQANGGDPAYLQWSFQSCGDYDQNGEVNVSDLTPLGLHFGKTGPFPYSSVESVVDGDFNGEINIADVTPIGMYFLTRVSEWRIYASPSLLDFPQDVDGPNGAGAQLAGTLPQSAALGLPSERRYFTFEMVQPGTNTFYWVRPHDGAADGACSYHVSMFDMDWVHSWGSAAREQASGLCTDDAGQIYIAGTTNVNGAPDTEVFFLRYGEMGDLQLALLFSGSGTDNSGALVRAGDDYYLAGSTNSGGVGAMNVLLMRLDENGNLGWGGHGLAWGLNGGTAWASSAAVDGDGNIWVAGTCDPGTGIGPLVLKFDSDGTLLFEQMLDLGGNGQLTAIAYDPVSDRIWLAGHFEADPGNHCALLAAMDPSGSLVLAKSFDAQYSDDARGIGVDSSGAVYVTGMTDADTAAQRTKMYLMKLNPAGEQIWGCTFYSDDHNYATGLHIDPLDRIYVCGSSYPDGDNTDEMVLLRLNSNAELELERYFPRTSPLPISANAVTVDEYGMVVVAGFHTDATETWKIPFMYGIDQGLLSLDSNNLQVPVAQLNSAVQNVDLTPLPAVWLEDSGAGEQDSFVSRLVVD